MEGEMTGKYYNEKIIGTPHHVRLWYDRSIRIWWSSVESKNGEMLDLESQNGMRTGFAMDAGNKTSAMNNAIELSQYLQIPVVLKKVKK
jgi:hypothetical protein